MVAGGEARLTAAAGLEARGKRRDQEPLLNGSLSEVGGVPGAIRAGLHLARVLQVQRPSIGKGRALGHAATPDTIWGFLPHRLKGGQAFMPSQ